MKKAFYDETTKRLVAVGFLDTFDGAVGEEVPDDFDAPLYLTQWDGKAFVRAALPENFTVASPEDLAAGQ